MDESGKTPDSEPKKMVSAAERRAEAQKIVDEVLDREENLDPVIRETLRSTLLQIVEAAGFVTTYVSGLAADSNSDNDDKERAVTRGMRDVLRNLGDVFDNISRDYKSVRHKEEYANKMEILEDILERRLGESRTYECFPRDDNLSLYYENFRGEKVEGVPTINLTPDEERFIINSFSILPEVSEEESCGPLRFTSSDFRIEVFYIVFKGEVFKGRRVRAELCTQDPGYDENLPRGRRWLELRLI